ncbi:LytTR family DNA-binding domain-containing protein [Marinoscillum furvescens]|uniref:LytTr DNA-binding domain-containing protein n=1 Tax=Marinoscillum furvescens DSM 4134 TaxID=1122208 RepID=A0A3D9L0R2_MARFU|nr:LytTR family DNA-binding domain-containing protein [Marinoscillum furvescens]RED94929.1 LytTr DNA-binding domain-containing protein [Marinoscillum furvescens DSM 4134]
MESALNKKIICSGKDEIKVFSQYDISYCQADSGYVNIVLRDGSSCLKSQTLNALAHELDQFQFVRVSQSFLINSLLIDVIDKKKKLIHLRCGATIPFSIGVKNLMNLLSLAFSSN